MIEANVKDAETKMQKSLDALAKEILTIRTGRASPALVDKIPVEYYGNPTPLNQLATITVPEARMILIQPWDRTIISAVEKAIQKSELGLNPGNDGQLIRVPIPPLNEERRRAASEGRRSPHRPGRPDGGPQRSRDHGGLTPTNHR